VQGRARRRGTRARAIDKRVHFEARLASFSSGCGKPRARNYGNANAFDQDLRPYISTTALGLLAMQISILGRGLVPVLVAAALMTLLLLVTFDLDRPTRGLIKVPSTPLVDVRASMALPPAAGGH